MELIEFETIKNNPTFICKDKITHLTQVDAESTGIHFIGGSFIIVKGGIYKISNLIK